MQRQKTVTLSRLRITLLLVATVCAAGLMLMSRGERFTSATEAIPINITPVPTKTPIADIDESVGERFRVELLSVSERGDIDLSGEQPRILIYHTHLTEAYRQTPGEAYEESGSWRTEDTECSVAAVGELLCEILRDEYGLSVLHDTTNHEPPKLSTAYSRSVETMKRYKEEYPSLVMFIDLHRDAYGSSASGETDFVTIDGLEVARMMFVVGTGEGATGTGYSEMPDFASNFALAERLTEYLLDIDSGLMRPIRVKTGRYNQHISSQCILVEVGHNANTLTQAKNAMRYLAAAIADCAGLNPVLQLTP